MVDKLAKIKQLQDRIREFVSHHPDAVKKAIAIVSRIDGATHSIEEAVIVADQAYKAVADDLFKIEFHQCYDLHTEAPYTCMIFSWQGGAGTQSVWLIAGIKDGLTYLQTLPAPDEKLRAAHNEYAQFLSATIH